MPVNYTSIPVAIQFTGLSHFGFFFFGPFQMGKPWSFCSMKKNTLLSPAGDQTMTSRYIYIIETITTPEVNVVQ